MCFHWKKQKNKKQTCLLCENRFALCFHLWKGVKMRKQMFCQAKENINFMFHLISPILQVRTQQAFTLSLCRRRRSGGGVNALRPAASSSCSSFFGLQLNETLWGRPVWASCCCHLFSVALSFISFNQRRQIELRGPAESQIDHVSSRKSAAT